MKSRRLIKLDATVTITRTGGYISYDDIEPEVLKKLRSRFTITVPSAIGGPPTTIIQYKTTRGKDKYLRIPRFGVSELSSPVKSEIKLVSDKEPSLKWIGKLNPNQVLIYDHICEIFSKDNMLAGKSGLILKLEAGRGKTFISLALIGKIRRKTLIVVHTKGILIQWRKLIEQWLPNASLGFYCGNSKVDGDIVIALIQSLSKDKLKICGIESSPTEFYSQFDFVIIDECHLMLSTKRASIFWKGQAPYMLGLSATPNEDILGRNLVSEWGLGKIVDAESIKGYCADDVKFTGRVHMVKYVGPEVYTRTIISAKGMVSVPLLTTQILRDPYRLFIVSREIIKLMKQNLHILVFASRREYLLEIRTYMKHLGVECLIEDDSTKVTRLVGGASEQKLEEAERESQVILTTYQYMSVGKSIQRMNAMVLATPRKSYNEQTIKRIFRLGSDNSIERQIVDIVDWGTTLKSQWYSRNKYFQSQNFEIEKTLVKWNDAEITKNMVEKELSIADEIALISETLGIDD